MSRGHSQTRVNGSRDVRQLIYFLLHLIYLWINLSPFYVTCWILSFRCVKLSTAAVWLTFLAAKKRRIDFAQINVKPFRSPHVWCRARQASGF